VSLRRYDKLLSSSNFSDTNLLHSAMTAEDPPKTFSEHSVVFTGKLASLSRREAQEVVVRLGGVAPARVTQSTTLLVMGEEGYLSAISKSNKLKRAEEINAQGGNVRIISESEFLGLAGRESKVTLEMKYYSLERIRRVYPRLRPDIVRYFAHWGLFTPAVKTNAQHYYEFKDLLTFRRIDELLAHKLPLREVAKRVAALRRPSPQISLPLDNAPRSPGVILALQKSANEPPRSAEEWYEIGFKSDGNPETYDVAIDAYEHALALAPAYVDAMINLANLYFHKNDLPRALVLMEKALQFDENNYLVCYNLANLYDESGQLERAVQLYQRALLLFPNYEPALFNAAVAYEKLGRHVPAKSYWKKYLEVEPEGEWAVIAKEHLAEANG
jgi:tetratricopeptide (TPR) repeat protein